MHSRSKVLADVIVFGNKLEAKQVQENRKLLGATIETVKFCGRQGLPLCGRREIFDEEDPHKNRGVFNGVLETISLYDSQIKSILEDVKEKQSKGEKSLSFNDFSSDSK